MNKNYLKILLFLTLIISISIISGCMDNTNDNITDSGEDFKFQDIAGIQRYLSDFRGKIVIVDLWATWCSPCGYQMLELEKIYNHYDKEKIEIISVDIDPEETINMVQQYIEEFKVYGINLDWIFGMDVDNIWEKYKINGGIPTLYIFDKNGYIHYKHEGVSIFSEIPEGWPQNTIKLKDIIDEIYD